MASAAEQLVANLNFSAFSKATELKKRIWFTLGALLIYRLGTYIPIPGINPEALADIFRQNQSGILGMFNMFAGGAVGRMAIFALNIMPYISASIIMQLMTTVSPHLEQLKKEGDQGRKQINQYTRYGTVLLATLQGYGIAVGLEGAGNVVLDPGLFFRLTTVITLVGGTVFLMWLGEQITARGVGNGISLIIFSGIVAELPSAIVGTFELGRQGALSTPLILGLFVMAIGVVAFIVFMERAQRRLLVQYPKRQMGNRMFQGDSSHLPLKLNTAGVIPPIFASSLLLLPITVANFSSGQGPDWLTFITAMVGRGQPLYIFMYVSLIVFFAFFYTADFVNPKTYENACFRRRLKLRQRLLNMPGDGINIKHSVDRFQSAAVPVITDQRNRLRVICLKTASHGFLIIVLAPGKFGRFAFVANTVLFRAAEPIMITLAAFGACEPAGDPFDQPFIIHFDLDNRVECFVFLYQKFIQRFSLHDRSWKAIEDKAGAAIGFVDTLRNDANDYIVRDQFAFFHGLLGQFANLRAGGDSRAQHIAGRQLDQAAPFGKHPRLGPFSGPGRSKEDQVHLRRDPRSLDFLINPSY